MQGPDNDFDPPAPEEHDPPEPDPEPADPDPPADDPLTAQDFVDGLTLPDPPDPDEVRRVFEVLKDIGRKVFGLKYDGGEDGE